MTVPDDDDFVESLPPRAPSPRLVKNAMPRNGAEFEKINHIPLIGSAIVEIMKVYSPSMFWVRPNNHITSQLILHEPTDMPLEEFKVSGNLVNRYVMAPLEPVSVDLNDETIERRRYGRARILEVLKEDFVRVLFIDEGRLEVVKLACLAKMPDLFFYHPWQAINVQLSGLRLRRNELFQSINHVAQPIWTKELIDIFKKILDEFPLFQVKVIKSTIAHNDFSIPHLVYLRGLETFDSKDSVDIATCFVNEAYHAVELMPVFNGFTYADMSKSTLLPRTSYDLQPLFLSFPENWARTTQSTLDLNEFSYEPDKPEFQIKEMTLSYLVENGYVRSDDSILFYMFDAFLYNPYEMYGIPLKVDSADQAEDDDNNVPVKATISAFSKLMSDRILLTEQLDAFYKSANNRTPIDVADISKWLKDKLRVFAICDCSGLEKRKRYGIYQRVEVIGHDNAQSLKVRFVDSGGCIMQMHEKELYKISAKHCKPYAMMMQLCWHGVKDADPNFADKQEFTKKAALAFKEKFFSQGIIRLKLCGSRRENLTRVYTSTNIAPCQMWNTMFCHDIQMTKYMTSEPDLLKVMLATKKIVADCDAPFPRTDYEIAYEE